MTSASISPLKHDVVGLVEKNYVVVTRNNSDSIYYNDSDSTCFDQNGNVIYQLMLIGRSARVENVLSYDKDGFHSSSKTYDGDSLQYTRTIRSQKIQPGQFESISYKDTVATGKTTYTFDKKSLVTAAKRFSIKDKKEVFISHQEQSFDANDRITVMNFYDSAGNISGKYLYSYSRFYGPDTIKSIVNKDTTVNFFIYDQYGNPLFQVTGSDTLDRHEYEYDKYGNWIKKVDYDRWRKTMYQTRKYYYKKGG